MELLTITGIIGGIFFYLIGYGWIGLLGWVLGGILSDVVLKIGGYQKFKATVLSYACFCLGIMGCPANLWFAGEAYWENIHTSMGDQYANTLQSLMPPGCCMWALRCCLWAVFWVRCWVIKC